MNLLNMNELITESKTDKKNYLIIAVKFIWMRWILNFLGVILN